MKDEENAETTNKDDGKKRAHDCTAPSAHDGRGGQRRKGYSRELVPNQWPSDHGCPKPPRDRPPTSKFEQAQCT